MNYGKNYSVYTKLQSEINPKLIKANCNCHIIHNSAKKALKVLSFDVEVLILKVFAVFSTSTKRVDALKECFEFSQEEYQEVLRHIAVRSLSLLNAIDRLMKHWTPLKMYFLEEGRNK